MEINNTGGADEAFDFDSDLFAIAFGGKEFFCAEVDKEVYATYFEEKWIVGDLPTVFDQGGFDHIMKQIFCH